MKTSWVSKAPAFSASAALIVAAISATSAREGLLLEVSLALISLAIHPNQLLLSAAVDRCSSTLCFIIINKVTSNSPIQNGVCRFAALLHSKKSVKSAGAEGGPHWGPPSPPGGPHWGPPPPPGGPLTGGPLRPLLAAHTPENTKYIKCSIA